MMNNQHKNTADYIRHKIRQARDDRQMSQEELGKLIGKTNVTVSDIERGKVGVSAVDLAYIAKGLHRPLSYFFPHYARIRVPKGELSGDETVLVNNYRRLGYTKLEKTVLELVEQLADFGAKGEARRLLDEVSEVTEMARGKD